MHQLSPSHRIVHRLLRSVLPQIANGDYHGDTSAMPPPQPWPMTRSEAAGMLVPGTALAVSVRAWSGSVPLGMAFAMAIVAWGWRRAAVRYGHVLLRRVTHQMRALDLRQSFAQRDALASAADTLVIAVVGLLPMAFLLQSLTLGLQAIGSPWTMLLAFLTTPISMVAFVVAILGAWRGYRTVNRLTDGRVADH